MQNEELRSTQVRLEISQRKYFELDDLAPVGYITISPKGIILEINLTATDLLGYPRSQLLSKNFTRFIFEDFQDVFYIHCRTALKSEKKISCELKLVNKNRHADADQASIMLLGSSPNIILRIEDNGRGFDVKAQELSSAATKRMGIRSMQERVNLLLGQMSIQSQSMKGIEISIKIPL